MEESESKFPDLQTIKKYFLAVMAVVYAGFGVALLVSPEHLFHLSSTYSLPLGIILIAYGIVRGYRAYQNQNSF